MTSISYVLHIYHIRYFSLAQEFDSWKEEFDSLNDYTTFPVTCMISWMLCEIWDQAIKLQFLKLASRTSMMPSPGDIPEPDGKPSNPQICEVGGTGKNMRNFCGCNTSEVQWNGSIGFWFVQCTTDSKAKGLHRGWRWPDSSHWTWCADFRRLTDEKIPPRVRRAIQPALPEALPLDAAEGPAKKRRT